tara:strand:- start:1779 stop:2291 length:513 start_codon:yes stop_codon:yes gene_type:complete
MNIFYLNSDPVLAAQMQCDKHVVKMILESAQMLCTAYRVLDGEKSADAIGLYKLAHKNHPSSIWVRERQANYQWLFMHMKALMAEYTYRYGKHHASERLLEWLAVTPICLMTCKLPFTPPPQCMPDKHKNDDPVLAYQKYYIGDKAYMAQWNKTREAPKWWKNNFTELLT